MKVLDWVLANGTAGILGAICLFLGWLVWTERFQAKKSDSASTTEIKEIIRDYERLIHDYHEVAINIARSVERLTTLLDERTRRQNNGRD